MTHPAARLDQAVTDLIDAAHPDSHVTAWVLSVNLLDEHGRERLHTAAPTEQLHTTTLGLAVASADYLRGHR